MNRLIAGAVLAAAAIATAATAGAGPDDFPSYGYRGDHDPAALAAEIQVAGYPSETTDQARGLAFKICGDRINGTSERTLIRMLDAKYTVHLAVASVIGAERHFCPAMEESTSDPEWATDASSI